MRLPLKVPLLMRRRRTWESLFVGNTQTALGRKDGPVGSDFVARKAVAAWCKGRARLAAPEIIDLGNPRSKFVPAASPVFR